MAAQPKPLHLEQANYLEGGGIYGWLTTIDHKRIAVLYGVSRAASSWRSAASRRCWCGRS